MASASRQLPEMIRPTSADFKPRLPINFLKQQERQDCFAIFDWMLEHEPVHKGKASVMGVYYVARYADCVTLLKDRDLFTKERGKSKGKEAGGGYPVPKHVRHLTATMINSDDPRHKRLRNLVQQAFTPKVLSKLDDRIGTIVDDTIDQISAGPRTDLMTDFALPIPAKVICEMVGVNEEEAPHFIEATRILTRGLRGWRIIKTVLWDLKQLDKLSRRIIARKRHEPAEDILTGLIHAESDGDRLDEDELVAMVLLIVLAGFETTIGLISNTVLMLLLHPEQLELARSDASMMDAAIEETLRFHAPVYGTEILYALQDVTLSGVTIPKGSAIFPLVGAANRDPRAFDAPQTFDITRPHRSRHLGFGLGIHHCLGAPLARMETKIAVQRLFETFPNLHLDVPPDALDVASVPFMRRYTSLPLSLR